MRAIVVYIVLLELYLAHRFRKVGMGVRIVVADRVLGRYAFVLGYWESTFKLAFWSM